MLRDVQACLQEAADSNVRGVVVFSDQLTFTVNQIMRKLGRQSALSISHWLNARCARIPKLVLELWLTL
jgi:hypothetical protein